MNAKLDLNQRNRVCKPTPNRSDIGIIIIMLAESIGIEPCHLTMTATVFKTACAHARYLPIAENKRIELLPPFQAGLFSKQVRQTNIRLLSIVPDKGLEPLRLSTSGFEPDTSTNFINRAIKRASFQSAQAGTWTQSCTAFKTDAFAISPHAQ